MLTGLVMIEKFCYRHQLRVSLLTHLPNISSDGMRIGDVCCMLSSCLIYGGVCEGLKCLTTALADISVVCRLNVLEIC